MWDNKNCPYKYYFIVTLLLFFYVYSYTSKLCKFTFIFKTNLKKKIYIQKSIKPNQWYSSFNCSSLISCKEEEFFSYVGQQKLPKIPTWFNPQPLKQKLSTQILFYSYTSKPGKCTFIFKTNLFKKIYIQKSIKILLYRKN